MKIVKVVPLFILMVSISFFMITCKHEIPGIIVETNPTQTNSCSPDTVYFVNEIQPLINSNCATAGCHDVASQRKGIVLTSYGNIMGYITPFSGANSRLYTSLSTSEERMPPAGPLTSIQIAKILKWINQGALNNLCTSGCDSTVFTYTAAVSVTMNTFCKGCHNPASLGGGIDLSTYAAVKTQALGRLTGSITHAAGYSAMPKGGTKLSDCQINQVQKWIQAGTLNN